jgi:uncharacterized membrane protein YtjA (UPF0391 family)
MRKWALTVSLVALLAGALGFVVMAGIVALIAKLVFFLLLVVLLLLLFSSARSGRK